MKRALRLKDSKSFTNILNTGRRVSLQSFNIFYINAITFSAGIIVSKKVSKAAVTRNKVKRQVRQVTAIMAKSQIAKNFVIIVKVNYLNNTYAKNKEQLVNFFNKVV